MQFVARTSNSVSLDIRDIDRLVMRGEQHTTRR
jgi:hypothetical protein